MFESASERLQRLRDHSEPGLFGGALRGIESEGLRITRDGLISQAPHPRCLGSALTHPYITTDYSEALLELITPPFETLTQTLEFLNDLHAWVSQCLNDELVWAASMPCIIESDESIPIADYGDSNVGRMKHVYRRGLGYRYGRAMQTIAGVHFNYSFPEAFWRILRDIRGATSVGLRDFVSEQYFALIRNFQRVAWLLPYLFGASPTVCPSFLRARTGRSSGTSGGNGVGPFATSLRMSDIGYRNSNQAGLRISYNDLDGYVSSLSQAIATPFPEYEAIGVKVDGEYRQLNANILQIENEYYSFVRPKRTALSGEKPTLALKRCGVEYLEVRGLDLNVLDPLGVNVDQLRFIEALLLGCALADSPPIEEAEQRVIDSNNSEIAVRGRDPELRLHSGEGPLAPAEWAARICDTLAASGAVLDRNLPEQPYQAALARQRAACRRPEALPSARIMADLSGYGGSFFEFAMEKSREYHDYFCRQELDEAREQQFASVVKDSLAKQAEIEAADSMSFDDYLANYLSQ